MPGRERAQTDRRQQPIMNHLHYIRPALALEHRVVERNRQHLVRPAGGIVTLLTVDNVVEMTGRRVPEARVERATDPLRMCVEVQILSILSLQGRAELLHPSPQQTQ